MASFRGKDSAWHSAFGTYVACGIAVFAIVSSFYTWSHPYDPTKPVLSGFSAWWASFLPWIPPIICAVFLAVVLRVRASLKRTADQTATQIATSNQIADALKARDDEIAGLKQSVANLEFQQNIQSFIIGDTDPLEASNLNRILQAEPIQHTPTPLPSSATHYSYRSAEDIEVQINPNESQHMKGFVLTVVNNRLSAIGNVKVIIRAAQSFDSRHNDYRDGRGFSRFTASTTEPIHAGCSMNQGVWFVRKDREDFLLAGNNHDHPLKWPDTDKSPIQRWLLTGSIESTAVPPNKSDIPVANADVDFRVVIYWRKETNEFAIERTESDQPLIPENSTDDAVINWLRRIHFQGRVLREQGYPSIIAHCPNGDLMGYTIETTIDGYERALQESVFHNLNRLRRFFIVLVSDHDRTSTAVLRDVDRRTLPPRTSIVIGHLTSGDKGGCLFVVDDERPEQKTWR